MSKKCDRGMSFDDCELTILRAAVDDAEEKIGKKIINSPEIQKIIEIVENFIKKKNLICYGGTAINNILPREDQFYNREIEMPDYDFFTSNALDDAVELADLYFHSGFTEVEAKSGQHFGTFKVFVNFIPVADVTNVPKELYQRLKAQSIKVAGIYYAPPNYLRMSMYLELSRPAGDTSRWEKVLKRLTLLNKHYPLTAHQCLHIDFQREMADKVHGQEIYETVKETLINQSVVFFGGYAISLYSKYMPIALQKQLKKIPDFDVISNDPETTAEIIKERLKDINIKNVKIIKRAPISDVIPEHLQIQVGPDTIAFIYHPIACHSYNNIVVQGKIIRVATIDTMLSYYLAFLYTGRSYYDVDRILCMAKFLFEVQQKNRLEQKGLLKRFSITCYGHQESREEMRAEKSEKFKELKDKRGTREFDEWFLTYRPVDAFRVKEENRKPKKNNKSTSKTRKSNNKQKSQKRGRGGFFIFK
uniref:Poly(A) polymerase catalytic subunit domain-containing protein n=1 Tax=viral metagenome TaxID=1070528 RepID=A0A6C0KYP4_9ZZZZ